MVVVGRIPYLNCALFFDRWGEGGPALVDMPPRQLGEEAVAGRLDAGPLALADVLRLGDAFQPLADLGISCPRKAATILLYSRRPMRELDGATIGVTGETASSVRLLKVLLHHRDHVRPAAYTSPDDPAADAVLLIGDAALRASYQDPAPMPLCFDLGEEWVTWQGLPFVPARWVVRRDLPAEDKAALAAHVLTAYREGDHHRREIAQERAVRMGLPVADVLAYFDVFRYELTDEDVAAEARFATLLKDTPDA